MRFCGVDVSPRAAAQQLVTLHPRRGAAGRTELVATFYAPGDAAQLGATVLGFGGEAVVCVDGPAGRRLDLLAAGRPLRAQLGLPAGRFERHRVCDALLQLRGLPLYPVPTGEQATRRWEDWLEASFAVHLALDALGSYRPVAPDGALQAAVGRGALRFGRVAEAYPDAVLSALLGHRPGPKRTPWGLQERIAALKDRGVVDVDGGLWQRTVDELDACALAYAAWALAEGHGTWAGDPREAVVVLPIAPGELRERYAKLPAPGRVALAGAAQAPVSPR